MSKRRSKSDSQMSIFEVLQDLAQKSREKSYEGQFKCIDRLRSAMRHGIKGCPLSVHQIAGEMSHLVDTSITADQIYSWTRASDELNGRPARHIPAEYLPAFCYTTKCNAPLEVMTDLAGLFALPGPDALRSEIQLLDEKISKLKALKRKRSMFLKEMQGR